MKRILKYLGITLAVLVGLVVVAVLVLVFVFDPNQYKGQIIQIVKDKTGRELKIEKKIGWSFFPSLGIEAGGLELANAPGFGKEPFAKIDAAGVGVQVLPLFRGHVAVDKVYLHGLTVNLARNAAGKTNWDDLVAASGAPEKKPVKTEADKKQPVLPAISVNRLEVKRANLNWRDQTAGSTLALRNLELATGRFVTGAPTDLHLAFDLARDQAAPIKTDLQGRLTLAPDQIKVANLNLAVDDSRLTGSLDVKNFASPAIQFDLTLDQIDIDRYLPPAEKKPAAAAPAAPAQPVALPLATLRGLDIKGKFRVQKLKAMNLRSTDALVQITAKNGLINLGPNQAKLYSGSYNGQTSLDVRGKIPQLALNESLTGVQLAPLLKDAYNLDVFHGAANLGAKLTAQGFDAGQVTSSLNGNANVSIKDGTLKGADLKKMVDAVNAAIADRSIQNLKELVPAKSDETKFTQLGATAQIRNGVARNEDLAIEVPNLGRISGKGNADLPRQQLDYRVTVGKIAVIAAGPFSALKFKPDVGAAAKQAAERKVEQKVEKARSRLLDKLKRK
jgi:AsmA protein